MIRRWIQKVVLVFAHFVHFDMQIPRVDELSLSARDDLSKYTCPWANKSFDERFLAVISFARCSLTHIVRVD